MRYPFGGLIFGGAYTWRGLFSEFYGIVQWVTVICSSVLTTYSCTGVCTFRAVAKLFKLPISRRGTVELGSSFGSIFFLFHIRVAGDQPHSSCQPQLLVTALNLSLILMLS